MTIRLLIADDHPVVRSGLVSLFADTDIEVIAEASTGDEAVRLAREHNPDVVLLDVRMPHRDGLAALSRIQLEQPDVPVLIFSNYDNPKYVARAVALGALGYLLKGCSRDELLTSIRDAAAWKDSWSREQLRKLGGSLVKPLSENGEPDVGLTRREMDVLGLMVDGKTNKEIAPELSISPETVKEHVKHILAKVGVTSRTQAAVWAVRNGVV